MHVVPSRRMQNICEHNTGGGWHGESVGGGEWWCEEEGLRAISSK